MFKNFHKGGKMNKKIYELINDQINKELYSAYLYVQIADFYADEGLDGYANYYMIQAAEERDHALIFRKYLLENGVRPQLLPIDQPDKTYKSGDFMSPLKDALEHEKYVTSLINNIVETAEKKQDYRAVQFLQWFVDEQMEEEDNANDMIAKMKVFGSDKSGLFALNKDYATRAYSTPSPLASE